MIQLTKKERQYFLNNCYKISPIKWATKLKHYSETYFISEVMTISNINFNI